MAASRSTPGAGSRLRHPRRHSVATNPRRLMTGRGTACVGLSGSGQPATWDLPLRATRLIRACVACVAGPAGDMVHGVTSLRIRRLALSGVFLGTVFLVVELNRGRPGGGGGGGGGGGPPPGPGRAPKKGGAPRGRASSNTPP